MTSRSARRSWIGPVLWAIASGPVAAIACATAEEVAVPSGGGGSAGSSSVAGASGSGGGSAGSSDDGGHVGAGAAGRGSGTTGGAGGMDGSGRGGAPGTGGADGGGATGPTGGAGRGDGGGAAGGSGSGGSPGGRFDAGGPPGAAFFDDFEDGDFTAPPGKTWVDADPLLKGMWSVGADAGNKVLAQSAAVSDWIIAASGDYRWTDQVVEGKVRFTSPAGMVGIFARLQDVRNYYFLYLDATNIVLRKRVNNSSTTMVKVKLVAPVAVGAWHVLKLAVVGAVLTGYLDGNMLVPPTISSAGDAGASADIPAGGIGVGSSDASAEFDDITVTRL